MTDIDVQPVPQTAADAICRLSATELAARIRSGELSAVEAVDAHLERIERRNGALNAYVAVLADDARARAASLDAGFAAGGAPVGALHGVPIAIKDVFDFKRGVANTFGGCVPLADFVPDEDAAHVTRLERAGAVVLGKTNGPEFGHKATTDNLVFGPTSTPFAPGMNAGGSSGGAAAAVADGLCALAQGSDGGGSIRIPAALCGVVGFKATFGRLADPSRPDAFAISTPFLHNGPLTRTVQDAALMLSVMAGVDDRDPFSVPVDNAGLLAAPSTSVAGLRVAYSPTLGGFPVEPAVRAVVDDAVAALVDAGVVVEEVEPRWPVDHGELSDLWLRLAATLGVTLNESFKALGLDLLGDARRHLTPRFAALLERGYGISLLDAKRDAMLRTACYDALQDVLDGHVAILSPTLGVSAVPNAGDGTTVGPHAVAGERVDPLIGWCLTHPANFTGHPAASYPAGLTADGSPAGLQVIGRRFDDETVLAIGGALERTRPWHPALDALAGGTR